MATHCFRYPLILSSVLSTFVFLYVLKFLFTYSLLYPSKKALNHNSFKPTFFAVFFAMSIISLPTLSLVADVHPNTYLAILFLYFAANTWAIIPPIDFPITWVFFILS